MPYWRPLLPMPFFISQNLGKALAALPPVATLRCGGFSIPYIALRGWKAFQACFFSITLNPLNHSLISCSSNLVLSFRYSMSSWLSCILWLVFFPRRLRPFLLLLLCPGLIFPLPPSAIFICCETEVLAGNCNINKKKKIVKTTWHFFFETVKWKLNSPCAAL